MLGPSHCKLVAWFRLENERQAYITYEFWMMAKRAYKVCVTHSSSTRMACL